MTIEKLVEIIASELSRQSNDEEESLGHYVEDRNSDGSLNYVAVDGNPNLHKLAAVIIAAFEN